MSYEVRVTHRGAEEVHGSEQVLTSEFRSSKAYRELADRRARFPHCRIVLTKREGDTLRIIEDAPSLVPATQTQE